MIKRFFIKTVNFFSGTSFWRNCIVTTFLFVLFALTSAMLSSMFNENLAFTIAGTALGFALSNILISIVGTISNYFEDFAKVSGDTKYLLSIYSGDLSYRKTLDLNDSQYMFIYNELLINQGYNLIARDDMNKHFELEEFFNNFYGELFESHSSSAKENTLTIRLDKIEKDKDSDTYTFYLSRSTFYNHLVTNRAIDYELENDLTIRSICEYGPLVTPLEESRLSNHVGINALVFLDDGHLLVPQRKGDSTISKHCITASIATRLTFPNSSKLNTEITTDYLFVENIYGNLKSRLKIDPLKLKRDNVEIKFLGVGQNIYEGGKPQMYFSVILKGVTKDNFSTFTDKAYGKGSKIDVDKRTHIVDFSRMRFKKNSERIIIHSYNEKRKKYRKHTVGFEKSLMCNVWHYQEDKIDNLIIIDIMGIWFDSVLPLWFKKEFGEEMGSELAQRYCDMSDNGSKKLKSIAMDVAAIHKKKSGNAIYKEWISSAVIDKEFIPIIKKLKKHSRVVLASNTSEDLLDAMLKKNCVFKLFDSVYPSYSMGCHIPEEKFFKKILSYYKRSFKNIYFIDNAAFEFDNIKHLGITPIHYDNNGDFIKILKENNLL